MFTKEELKHIDSSYFCIINCNIHTVTLKSKNTNHWWHILHQAYPHFSSCSIYHRHNETDSYHIHGHAPNLNQAMDDIKNHDSFQLNGRKKYRPKK